MTLISLIIGTSISVSIVTVLTTTGLKWSVIIYIFLFALKIFLDDITHFKTNENNNVVANGFLISIILWVLFGVALYKATPNIELTAYILIIINLLAIVWLSINHMGVEEKDAESYKRQRWWVYINSLYIISISTFLVFHSTPIEGEWSYLFYVLSGVVVVDALALGTIPRLVSAFKTS